MTAWLWGWWRREVTCQEVRQHASEYVEGALAPRLLARVQRHLARCRQCTTFVRTLQATVSALRGLPRHGASEAMRRRIVEETHLPPGS